MSGTLFLGGGGSAEQSKDLDDALAARLSADHKPTCLYIPAAMEQPKHGAAHEWFTGTYGQAFSQIEMLGRLSDLDHSKTFDVIYMGGGNTGRLLDGIYASGFDKYLLRHLEEGRAAYGGSAGAIVFGRTILTAPPAEHSTRTNDGLDMLGGNSVVAHYNDKTDRERVAEMSRSLDCVLLAIPEDAGVVADGPHMTTVGKTDVMSFEPNQAPYALPPGAEFA